MYKIHSHGMDIYYKNINDIPIGYLYVEENPAELDQLDNKLIPNLFSDIINQI